MLNDNVKNLQPDKFYSALEICELGLFPWIESHRSVLRLIKNDIVSKNELKTIITGDANNKTSIRYYIKGSDLLDYINKRYESKTAKKGSEGAV